MLMASSVLTGPFLSERTVGVGGDGVSCEGLQVAVLRTGGFVAGANRETISTYIIVS